MHLSNEHAKELIRIARKHGAMSVCIFGSYARGDADRESDLDVLVEFERGRSLFDLVRLERELRDALGIDVDVVTPNSLHPIIRERVMEEKVALLRLVHVMSAPTLRTLRIALHGLDAILRVSVWTISCAMTCCRMQP